MASTDKIIDQCILGIGEEVASPLAFTRADILEFINQLYQNDIGKRVRNLASFSYDASDAAHTITAGVGALPSDYLAMAHVYDGDAPTNEPLTQITKIEDRVAGTATTSQYMIPDNANLWIFGITPTNTIKLYYYQKPTALTDASSSSPTALNPEFHIDIFVARIKEVYALRQNNTYGMMDMKSLVLDLLNQIEVAHGVEKQDDSLAGSFRPIIRW